jgi:hypothetical protein
MPYTVTAEDGTEVIYQVTANIATGSEAQITGFNLGVYKGKIDEAAKTITITVATGTTADALKALTTKITKSTYAKVAPATGIAGNFVDGKAIPYTVTSEDKKTTVTYQVTANIDN